MSACSRRIGQLDTLRGYAVALMLVDHALNVLNVHGVLGSWVAWPRLTVTRLALPLFMIVSGFLLGERGRRPSSRRLVAAALGAAICNPISFRLGVGVPEILTLYVFAVWFVPGLLSYPLCWLVLGLIQTTTWPVKQFEWYQPGYVIAWVALGRLVWEARADVVFDLRLPGGGVWSWVGRNALAFYVGHWVLLSVLISFIGKKS